MLVAPGPTDDVATMILLASGRFSEGCCGQGHALLILSAPGRNFFAVSFERVTERGHVAVAKNAVDPGE
jgi:hypothetical protein